MRLVELDIPHTKQLSSKQMCQQVSLSSYYGALDCVPVPYMICSDAEINSRWIMLQTLTIHVNQQL